VVTLSTVAFCSIPQGTPCRVIAGGAVKLYNLQPNQSSSHYFPGASAFIWLGCKYKRWADAHFFFGKSF
jgi:hypothetical protein